MPLTLHTPAPLAGSTEKTTGLPDPPPVADSVADCPAMPSVGGVKVIACGIAITVSESTAFADTSVSTWPGGSETPAMSMKALPEASVDESIPMRVKVAEAPLARLTPVHSNWPEPSSAKLVPSTELVALSAVNPPLSVSATAALVTADGPWLVSVIV